MLLIFLIAYDFFAYGLGFAIDRSVRYSNIQRPKKVGR